jgi:CRP-like cAMP-binding protein/predicted negative regulator of RcsB-dependent stress response
MSNGVGKVSTRTYKAGSVVYFEGDKSEYIYILKAGKVLLTYLKPETGEEIKEHIKPGEFFGVKSALGRYPREETAQTLSDTTVLVLTLADFEGIVLSNIAVVKKMLSVFSNQLRRIGKAQREVLGETNVVNPEAELFKTGEYYFRAGKYSQAGYIFKKYMGYYPDGQNAPVAMKRIKDIQTGNIGSDDSSPDFFGDASFGEEPAVSAGLGGDSFGDASAPSDMIDFDDGTTVSHATELSTEMDDFLGSSDDFFSPSGVSDKLARAKSQFESGDFAGAAAVLKEIVDDESLGMGAEAPAFEEAHLELGKTFVKLGKAQDALNAFSLLLKRFPQSEHLKQALYTSGMIFQQAGNKQKAAAYFQKVAGMQPADDTTFDARRRLNQLGV